LQSDAEVASRLRISRARVSQIADMVLLPVLVQEAILRGEVVVSERDLRQRRSELSGVTRRPPCTARCEQCFAARRLAGTAFPPAIASSERMASGLLNSPAARRRKESIMRGNTLLLGALAVGGIGAAAAGCGAVAGVAPGPAAVRRIGVFESRAIAVAFASSKFGTQPKELMEEYRKAEAAGDKKRMEELKGRGKKRQDKLHLQGFGRVPVDDLLAPVKDRIADVAKAAGVDVIADDVSFAAPGVEKVEVTDAIVKLYDPSEKTLKTVAEIKKTVPLPLDKFPIED
jgi:hypothetical protein